MTTTINHTEMDKENLPLITAKFPGTCSITNLPINKGDLIFYNPKTKKVIRAIKVYATENFLPLMRTDSWLFKIVERMFDDYMDEYGDRNELSEMYFSEDAIYSKRGAIEQAIENIFEEIKEENAPFAWLHKIEVTVAFQD